jgi:heparan-alpha-glucosaminide N-acetyltransferase
VPRLMSVDAFRGLVMLLLVSDINGAFSFYEMARRFPDSPVWRALGTQFSHVEWSGAAIWDLIMPSFVFLIGIAMPLSHAARARRGETGGQIALHAGLRVITLLLLGLTLRLPISTNVDFIWPFLLLLPGLPIEDWTQKVLRPQDARVPSAVHLAIWVVVLIATAVRLIHQVQRLGNYDLGALLPQVAFAYALLYPLVNRSLRAQFWAFAAILFGYWLAFALYPLPQVAADSAEYTGWFAHWNIDTNLAGDFDLWFLNLLPRATRFAGNDHGYQTLNFIPTAATMLIGMMVGHLLQSGSLTAARFRKGVTLAGVASLLAGLVLGTFACPIVKSIWTPTWVLFSGGIVLLVFALFYFLCEELQVRAGIWLLVAAGSNTILLYVLACNYKWWFLERWRDVFGSTVFVGTWQPLLESVAFMLSAWLLAVIMHRMRIFIRL